LLAGLRQALPRVLSANVRLQLLDLGLRAEQEQFRAAAGLRPNLGSLTRRQLVRLALAAADGAYGAGLLNARLHRELQAGSGAFEAGRMALSTYRDALTGLGRAPGWGLQALRMHFQAGMDRLGELEPLAQLFIQDQLRSSSLLFYSSVLEVLLSDAGRLAGVRHSLFGTDVGFGLSALNPGLARGRLHARPGQALPESIDSAGIYVLPETIAELPPVAGILTAGEGNPLSHVQLLARNLGIPNVVVADSLLGRVAEHDGQDAVLAVSPGGLVELDAWSERRSALFASGGGTDAVVIRPDLDKLDLQDTNLHALDSLREQDSGRIVGPKAAKLGELKAHYPAAVGHGIALPFGVFYREALQRPWPGDASGQTSVYEWMRQSYRTLAALPAGSAQRQAETEAFRSALYETVAATPLGPGFREQLRATLRRDFGEGPWPGFFIRSDTNVEDLPGFTGAGLNLTLPNVVGLDALLEGIPRVWASPFTARAFAWRQTLMERPEHVYTSVLLLESVPVDKSGVLVTRDIDSGDPGVLSVAVNEGPGGAVDGQAAESLRIPLDGSPVRVLATATAPTRRVLLDGGGVASVPASGDDTVLQAAEIGQLIEFARDLPERFPPIVDAEGRPAPADVEFGFLGGSLQLFQIRPFLDSASARRSDYLGRMDAALHTTRERDVQLDEVPQP